MATNILLLFWLGNENESSSLNLSWPYWLVWWLGCGKIDALRLPRLHLKKLCTFDLGLLESFLWGPWTTIRHSIPWDHHTQEILYKFSYRHFQPSSAFQPSSLRCQTCEIKLSWILHICPSTSWIPFHDFCQCHMEWKSPSWAMLKFLTQKIMMCNIMVVVLSH